MLASLIGWYVDEKRRKEESITYISKDSGGCVDEKRRQEKTGEEGRRRGGMRRDEAESDVSNVLMYVHLLLVNACVSRRRYSYTIHTHLSHSCISATHFLHLSPPPLAPSSRTLLSHPPFHTLHLSPPLLTPSSHTLLPHTPC